ncbi:sensor histidine kinase, partial [Leptospira sp. SA-E8]|uniref:sensor histidine kinase n=1 Tax=Leptospira sp. SA-E8 TaxID=3422259 RepID=UPI003EBFE6CC
LALMSIRMGARLAYELVLPPELAAQPVPPLLLQPIVENSIKHGLEPQLQGGRIEVRAHREGARLVLEVSDSGAGHDGDGPDGDEGSGGFGLTQVRQRLATLYGDGASYEFRSAPGAGARTRITLPVNA